MVNTNKSKKSKQVCSDAESKAEKIVPPKKAGKAAVAVVSSQDLPSPHVRKSCKQKQLS